MLEGERCRVRVLPVLHWQWKAEKLEERSHQSYIRLLISIAYTCSHYFRPLRSIFNVTVKICEYCELIYFSLFLNQWTVICDKKTNVFIYGVPDASPGKSFIKIIVILSNFIKVSNIFEIRNLNLAAVLLTQ